MNNVQVSGNLANDPVVRTVPSGKKYVIFLLLQKDHSSTLTEQGMLTSSLQ